jgi:hypothetical protein
VFRGGRTFEESGRPHVLRLEVPVSAEEMVAALYTLREHADFFCLEPGKEVWRNAAMVIVRDGLGAVESLADETLVHSARNMEHHGEWLEVCRSLGLGGCPGARRRRAVVPGSVRRWSARAWGWVGHRRLLAGFPCAVGAGGTHVMSW